MVTLEEFIRHVVTSALVMLPGLVSLVYIWRRYDIAHRATKRFAIAYVALLGLIALMSRGSVVRERRCPRDPQEFCRYNDSVAFMAMIALFYLIAALIVARVLYNER